MVAQQAPADRVAGPGAQRDVEKDQAASSPQDPRLRHDILFRRRGEVLHREIDTAQVGVRVKIDSGPGCQRPGHGQQRGACTTTQDPGCVQQI